MPTTIQRKQNGYLAFSTEHAREQAIRLLKSARVRYPGTLERWHGGGKWKVVFPGVSQLVVRGYWENAMETAGLEQNPKQKKEAITVPSGTVVRFDGKSRNTTNQGFFDVRVVEWNYGADHDGRLPYALVENVRTGKRFEAYHHNLHIPNPRSSRPSLIGTVLDSYFPFDAMEGVVQGAVGDVKELANPSDEYIQLAGWDLRIYWPAPFLFISFPDLEEQREGERPFVYHTERLEHATSKYGPNNGGNVVLERTASGDYTPLQKHSAKRVVRKA